MGKDKDNVVTIDHVEVVSDTKKVRSEFYFEVALVLVLGFLIGMVVKTEAVKRITMGYEDYQIKLVTQAYDFKSLEDELMSEYKAQTEAANPTAGDEVLEAEEPVEEK